MTLSSLGKAIGASLILTGLLFYQNAEASIATTTCSYTNPFISSYFSQDNRVKIGPLTVTSTETLPAAGNINTPNHNFQFASSTCVTETSDSGGGGGSTDVTGIEYALTYGFGTIIFLLMLTMTFTFIKKR